MKDAATREREFRRRVRRAQFGLRLVRRASRKQKSWLDRLLTRFLRRASTPDPAADFMRDEIVDANIGFDAEELERYQRSGTTLEGGA